MYNLQIKLPRNLIWKITTFLYPALSVPDSYNPRGNCFQIQAVSSSIYFHISIYMIDR